MVRKINFFMNWATLVALHVFHSLNRTGSEDSFVHESNSDCAFHFVSSVENMVIYLVTFNSNCKLTFMTKMTFKWFIYFCSGDSEALQEGYIVEANLFVTVISTVKPHFKVCFFIFVTWSVNYSSDWLLKINALDSDTFPPGELFTMNVLL